MDRVIELSQLFPPDYAAAELEAGPRTLHGLERYGVVYVRDMPRLADLVLRSWGPHTTEDLIAAMEAAIARDFLPPVHKSCLLTLTLTEKDMAKLEKKLTETGLSQRVWLTSVIREACK